MGSVYMAEGKETSGGHLLPSPNTAPSSNGIAAASNCILGGIEGSDDSDVSDDTGSGSEPNGDSDSGHGVGSYSPVVEVLGLPRPQSKEDFGNSSPFGKRK